jgi:NAD(P)-dependent dehydrogenase (short-subunit alcohol dehydrogenase family)
MFSKFQQPLELELMRFYAIYIKKLASIMSASKIKKQSNNSKIIQRKTALITGGSKRIGREISLKLAELNYDLVIHYNNSKDEAEKLARLIEKKYSVRVSVFKADLLNHQELKSLVDFMKKNFFNWSLLINNASFFYKSKFLDEDFQKDWQNNLDIHLMVPIYLIKEFTQHVLTNKIDDAQVINMLDKNIARHDTKYFNYLITKKFLATATKMIALEIAPNVRINGISPGLTLASIDSDNPQKELEMLSAIIPLKKTGNIENILQTLEFLIKNKFITGQIISIDGGSSLNHAG